MAAAPIRAAIPSSPVPCAIALASTRSAASPLRVSTKRRYHDPSRLSGTAASSGGRGKRGGLPRVPGDEGQAVHKRQGAVSRVETGQDVRHRCQHGQAGAPPGGPVAYSEGHAGAGRRDSGWLGAEHVRQAQYGLGDDQRQPLLEALFQAAQVPAGRVRLGPQHDEHVAVLHLHAVGADVVGERVEGAARDQVKAGVVPVAGQKPVFDGPPVEREAHVGAAVVHGERLAVAQEHTDRRRADLTRQASFGPQLLDVPDPAPQGFARNLFVAFVPDLCHGNLLSPTGVAGAGHPLATLKHEVWLRSRAVGAGRCNFWRNSGLNGSMDEEQFGPVRPTRRTRKHRRWPVALGAGALVAVALLNAGGYPAGAATADSAASAWRGSGEVAVASGGRLVLLDDAGATHSLDGPGVVSAPAWSADGKWVAFLRTPAAPASQPWTSENSALWVARANGTDAHALSAHPLGAGNGDVTQFEWSPASAGEKLAFSVSYPPQYTSRIFLATPEPTHAQIFAGFNELIGFRWAPGGNSLAISYRTSPGAGFKGVLEISPLIGASPRTVYTLPQGGYVELASWWPNGNGIVFWADPAGSASIAADGLSLESFDFSTDKATNLATTLTYTNWLAWSPNGRTLAVVDGGDRSIWASGKHVELCAVPAAACHAAPLPGGPVVSLEPTWTTGGSLLFVVAPGTKASTIGSPPNAPSTGTSTGAEPYSDKSVAAWYNAQQLYSLGTTSGRADVVAAAGRGAHTPTGTAHGLLFVRDDRLWYLASGSSVPLAIAGGLESPSPYGNYYGYIDWSEDYAWHK